MTNQIPRPLRIVMLYGIGSTCLSDYLSVYRCGSSKEEVLRELQLQAPAVKKKVQHGPEVKGKRGKPRRW